MNVKVPRIVIAGFSGDSGKTLVSVGLCSALKNKGFKVFPFKKGPDYIDSSWLSAASGSIARNLDTFIMGRERVLESFLSNTHPDGFAVIEGNRGLFDGLDEKGTHSTAELAKLLEIPVILIINVVKMTRTAAAVVLGAKYLDIGIDLAGVIINNYSGKRHKEIITKSIEEITGVSVIGAIPRLPDTELFPSRHLGLVTPQEYEKTNLAIENAKTIVENYVDIAQIIEIGNSANDIFIAKEICKETKPQIKSVKIGYLYDKAFTFYYPENLEALENEGAELVQISAFDKPSLPDIDGLYIGGGFPENYADELSKNKSFIRDLKEKADSGFPIFAECGGLIYLAEKVELDKTYELVGIFPITISLSKKPVGHGYFEGTIDSINPYFEIGTKIKAHEFHYSFISKTNARVETCVSVERGVGAINSRDGLFKHNVFASYLHLHNFGYLGWSKKFVELCKMYKNIRKYRNLITIVK